MNITGLILAGGRGSRMGSVDKGLQLFQGKPMVSHVLSRLQTQVDNVVINANRNVDQYEAFGHPVIADGIDGFAGPLAGLHAGMTHVFDGLIATAPCDSPFLPLDLVRRLRVALEAKSADLAVAKTLDQAQPVFCLVKRDVEPHLREFLASGQRKIDKWYETLSIVEVAFDDQVDAFANINTAEELVAMQQKSNP
jgi:molybdenum cofactor guanylyltransferase